MMKRMGLIVAAVAVVVLSASAAEARSLRAKVPGGGDGVDQRVSAVRLASATQPQPMPQPIADPLATGVLAPGCASPVSACAPACTPSPCVCCPTPCIVYRHALLDVGRLCRPKCCKPPVKLVLATKNPCTCCPVDVPVCLPGCCCGEPKVDCRKTLIGEGLVTYDWCCGVSVSIRYKKCGEVVVTYRGV